MGVVYQAEDVALRRMVALKAMLPSLAASATARERFLREARAAAAVEHDHIVAIYQVGEDRGVPFLAMPFLKGESLDARLTRDRRLPVAEVLRVARETATGLEAARQRGLIHRDIKPANLWLEEGTGRVKILDFGLARSAGDEGHLTQQGVILGTPAYMAPEQAGGPVDHRADLFSLGCVMYRMATGEPPFKGSDTISILMAVATEEPRPPREIEPRLPAALTELILRLLSKRPEARPASAQAVVEAIRVIEAATTVKPAPARRKPAAVAGDRTVPDKVAVVATPPPRRRGGGLLLGLGLFAVVLLAGFAAGGYFLLPYLHLPAGATSPTTEHTGAGPGQNPAAEAPWEYLFNGKDLSGWVIHKGRIDNWGVEKDVVANGADPGRAGGGLGGNVAEKSVLFTNGADRGWLLTKEEYSDFELRLDYRITPGTNTGVALRAPLEGDPTFTGMEVQIIDDAAFKNLKPNETNGALYGLQAPQGRTADPVGKWNALYITARGRRITADLNGVRVLDADLDKVRAQARVFEGMTRTSGRIGLQSHTNRAEFSDIRIRPFRPDHPEKAP